MTTNSKLRKALEDLLRRYIQAIGNEGIEFYAARAALASTDAEGERQAEPIAWFWRRNHDSGGYTQELCYTKEAAYSLCERFKEGRTYDEVIPLYTAPAQPPQLSEMKPQSITAEALLHSVFTRPDLTEQGRELFFREFMKGETELTLGWGDFRMMAATVRAILAQQGVQSSTGNLLVCESCGADRTKEDCKGDRVNCGIRGAAQKGQP
jgi:hypothetical protein